MAVHLALIALNFHSFFISRFSCQRKDDQVVDSVVFVPREKKEGNRKRKRKREGSVHVYEEKRGLQKPCPVLFPSLPFSDVTRQLKK